MDHLPLPSLQLYTLFSSAGLLYAVVYSLMKPEDVVVSLWSDVVCATVRFCVDHTSICVFTRIFRL